MTRPTHISTTLFPSAASDSGVFCIVIFFFFNDTATTEIYTLSLHDALPISHRREPGAGEWRRPPASRPPGRPGLALRPSPTGDRKSTRLNSSHSQISYAVFCLKKKKKHQGIISQYNALCIMTLLSAPPTV